eukprot:CAMPEP_0205803748 /NCGR_PEP_ID=MMETSP0205-20121125/6483_1 /ASSEMBLY_ACC=CAM_ASM_000278 /TAXON_ID=36767 /ORGANISM="Euplotes focardii, Strain TN1" /LENGTH=151 /DNA_ID=CAMNT_0053072299 /DNA_START=47 /DNA_END=502 /DNA_ORIENTATION=-
MTFEDDKFTESIKHDKKKKNQDHHTSHDRRVHNRGSRDSYGSHAEESKGEVKDSIPKGMKHEGHDKKSGTGPGKDNKKHGHGKGGWGDEDYEKIAQNHSATEAAALLEAETGAAPQEEEQASEAQEDQAKVADKEHQEPLKVNDDDFPSLG